MGSFGRPVHYLASTEAEPGVRWTVVHQEQCQDHQHLSGRLLQWLLRRNGVGPVGTLGSLGASAELSESFRNPGHFLCHVSMGVHQHRGAH